ncbi:MAG: hypothetical protein AB7H90_01115 [Alphaproteobacteria bacterium]
MDGLGSETSLYDFTAKGLIVLPGISWEDWTDLWHLTTRLHRTSLFYIGDAAVAGQTAFGEKFFQVAGDYAPETVRNAMWVCSRIEPHRRRPETLSFSAHQAVASLAPEEQDELLAQAEAEGWRTAALRAEVQKRKEARGEARYAHNGGPPLGDDASDDGEDEGGDTEPQEAPTEAEPAAGSAVASERAEASSALPPASCDLVWLRHCLAMVRDERAPGELRVNGVTVPLSTTACEAALEAAIFEIEGHAE